eukprot:4205998-Alexandrium_andersonii.AAC.1
MRGADVTPREIRWKQADSGGDEGDQLAEQEHAGRVGRRIKPAGQEPPTLATPGRPHTVRQGPSRTHRTRG